MIEQVKQKVLKITFLLWMLSTLFFAGILWFIDHWLKALTTLDSLWEDPSVLAIVAIVYLLFNWLIIRSARYEFQRFVKKYWEHHNKV